MTLKNRTDCRTLRSAILRFGCAVLAAAVLYVQPQPAPAGGEWYGLPNPVEVKATQAEIDQLDAETQAVVDALNPCLDPLQLESPDLVMRTPFPAVGAGDQKEGLRRCRPRDRNGRFGLR